MKKSISLFVTTVLIVSMFTGCNLSKSKDGSISIKLSDKKITVDGKRITSNSQQSVFLSNDIIYYEDTDTYESGNKYGDGNTDERHSKQQADAHSVINITKAGKYVVSGKLSKGQIRIDLGEDAKTDETAVVELVLKNVELSCAVAPAILFKNVYECIEREPSMTFSAKSDTSKAGANIIIADKSENTVNGSHVARIYEDAQKTKVLCSQSGAIYSYMSMNINAESEKSNGVLNITADNDAISSKLDITINGASVNVKSDKNGINAETVMASIITVNNAELNISAGLKDQGSGIGSKGWLVINSGDIVTYSAAQTGSGFNSARGTFINGGNVVSLGSNANWADKKSVQTTMNLSFKDKVEGGKSIVITDSNSKAVFAYNPAENELADASSISYSNVVISCEKSIKQGETYNLYLGGTVTGNGKSGMLWEIENYEVGEKQMYTLTSIPDIDIPQNDQQENSGQFSFEDVTINNKYTSSSKSGLQTNKDSTSNKIPNASSSNDNKKSPELTTSQNQRENGIVNNVSKLRSTSANFVLKDTFNLFLGICPLTDDTKQ